MSLSTRVEDLARAVVCLDATDLPALVRLQDELADLAASIEEQEQRGLVSACLHAAGAIEAIVLRSAEDADAALAEVRQAIEYAQQITDAALTGADPSTLAVPAFLAGASDAREPDFDMELLGAWVSSCTSALSELESAAISLDAGEEDIGQDAEARRIIHTIKGEAGILSLGSLQAVCHDCETLIDLAKQRGSPFPVEEVLAIIDWIRGCVEVLSTAPSAALPPHQELHAKIKESISRYAPGAGSEGAALAGDAPASEFESDLEASLLAGDATGAWGQETDALAVTVSRPSDAPASERQAEPADAAPVVRASTPTPGAPTAPEAPASSGAPAFQGEDAPVVFPPEAVIDETAAEFVCEAREHIANAEQSLLDLESDLGNIELINTVFRAFHTIKGVSGFMSLTPIVRLTHVAETLLDQARSGKLDLTPGHLDLFLRACDVLAQLIGAIQGAPGPMRSVFEALMGDLNHAAETGDASAPLAPPAAAPRTRTPTPETPGVPQARRTGAPPAAGAAPGSPAIASPVTAPTPARASAKASGKIEQTVKVNTTRMDALVDMVGELVIGYQMVYQDQAIQGIRQQHTQRTLGHVSKIIRDLQEVAMSLRLVTLRATFQKMARLVRDVSAKAGKNIRFHVEGEDVELDRNVVEEIADPLVHMIRNACDHGIEPAADRVKAGKTAEGNLYLRAYHQGGSIVVEVADDGRGLRRDKIVEKAIAKGLIPTDRDPAEMPDSEVFNLIFAPGFSTADEVTDISGRGVGMDVVRRNIEALRGKVEIHSRQGEGSTFKMRLPLTMAIIDGMVVRVGSQRYVIPTLAIEQSFRPRDTDIHTVVGRGEMVKVRGNLLPVYRAKSIFGLRDGADRIGDGLLVVLEAHNARFCLLVDEIVGQQQVVIKTLGHGLPSIPGVSGGAILGDGRVALILDVGGLIQEATRAAA